jgi:hypothetical protein
MTEDEGRAIAEAAAHAEIARKQMHQTEAYLARGRPYQHTPGDELAALWVDAMREWAKVIYPRPQVGDDTEAEFALRGAEPPWDAARLEMERIIEVATAVGRGMTLDQKHAAGADMIDMYLDEKERSQ